MICKHLKRLYFFVLLAMIIFAGIAMDRIAEVRLKTQIREADIRHKSDLEKERALVLEPDVVHPDCGCVVHLPRPVQLTSNDSDLTCSRFSGLRGNHQRVISFTFYEEEDKSYHRNYFGGVEKNLKALNEFYGPNWTMRLYYEVPSGSPTMIELCKLVCSNSNFDICDVHKIPKLSTASLVFPKLWRFFPLLDKQVDIALIRDLDSVINFREVAAVKEFLNSDRDFHVMRDHPFSHDIEILAGLWGVKLTNPDIRSKSETTMKTISQDRSIFYASRNYYDKDQRALASLFWPWAKEVSMQHDSYTCQKYGNNTRAFPTRRSIGIGNFVGSIPKLKSEIYFDDKNKCPEECRPPTHHDWTYC